MNILKIWKQPDNTFLLSSNPIQLNKIAYRKLSNTQVGLDGFVCSKKKFADYLRVGAYSDQDEHVGQTWIFTYEEKIIGFITIAMAHMKKDKHKKLNIDNFGNIPALLIGHLATHKDYERQGVGTFMISWAISKAREYSESIGCRFVILTPEKNVIGFYEKLKFVHAPHEEEVHDSIGFMRNHPNIQ